MTGGDRQTRDGVQGAAQLFVAGLSHRTCPADLRERLEVEEAQIGEVLARLSAAGLRQAVLLSTCDRVEVQGADPAPDAAATAALRTLAEAATVPAVKVAPYGYRLIGAEARRHICAVASSLDSLVVGEPQVLGQLKDGHRRSLELGLIGPELAGALATAYAVAKRVRHETAIAEQPVSIAAAAVRLARELHGDLARRSALLLGLGEMGEILARAFAEAGVTGLSVMARSPRRGEALALALGARFRPLDELTQALGQADLVVAAVAAARPTVTPTMMEAALRTRRRAPVLLVDLGVPGDVDPAVDRLDGAFLYALDDLERIASGGRARRENAARAAWAVLDRELAARADLTRERGATPAVVALRRHFERVRQEILLKAGGAGAEEVTRLLVNRLLHDPSEALRRLAREIGHPEDQARIERTLLNLFGIERHYPWRSEVDGGVEDDGNDERS